MLLSGIVSQAQYPHHRAYCAFFIIIIFGKQKQELSEERMLLFLFENERERMNR